jgi:type IV pilus assembly protein PilW
MFSSSSLKEKQKQKSFHTISEKMAGFTLVEMMVSLALGITLLLGVTKLYLSVQEFYRYTNELSSLQNRAIAASHVFNSIIRSAGFIGCRSQPMKLELESSGVVLASSAAVASGVLGASGALGGLGSSDTMEAIHGFSSSQAMAVLGLPGHGIGSVKQGSDSIVIQKAGNDIASVIEVDGNYLTMPDNAAIRVGDVLVISDCKKSLFSVVKGVEHLGKIQRVLMSNVISKVDKYDNDDKDEKYDEDNIGGFGKDAIASPYVNYIFYVGNTGRHNKSGLPIYALYLQEKCGSKKETNELIEGVDGLQVKYNVRLNEGNGSDYLMSHLAAPEVKDWTKVSSVKIVLTLTSMEAMQSTGAMKKTGTMQTMDKGGERERDVGKSFGGDEDKRMMVPLEMVITLRNRVG